MEVITIVGLCWFTFLIVPLWMVAILCVNCRNGAPTRIASYGDYIDSNSLRQFGQGHPSQTVSSFTVIRSPTCPPLMNTQLMPPMVPPESRRTSLLDVRESDNESLPNYENTAKAESSDEEVDCPNSKNSNYIVVIPDDVPTMTSPLMSTRGMHTYRISSGTLTEDYENLKEEGTNDGQGGSSNYVNIDAMGEETEGDSNEEEEQDSSDYVNSSNCILRR